jgi:hypothetical protein
VGKFPKILSEGPKSNAFIFYNMGMKNQQFFVDLKTGKVAQKYSGNVAELGAQIGPKYFNVHFAKSDPNNKKQQWVARTCTLKP